ncbi:MAG: hypothetical protein ISR47_06350 [Rhodospirillales bacterium]|nr:hypothetical protein [Rhodospirillales bacterium]
MTAARIFILVVAVVVLAAATGTPAQAHGTGWARENVDGAVGLRFAYTDGARMPFAKVTIIGPDGLVFQQARADREGRFFFMPTKAGDWLVRADDGTGHAVSAKIVHGGSGPTASWDGSAITKALAAVFRPVGIILGLSLMANLVGGLAWWRMRKKSA